MNDLISMAVLALFLALCAHGEDVTILVIEEVTNRTLPPYDFAANITNLTENSVLIDVMNNAANCCNFVYDAAPSDPCGYKIHDINGQSVSDRHYWQILQGEYDGNFTPLNLGGRTSNYYPKHGGEILFRLATWDGLKKNVTLKVTGDSMSKDADDMVYVISSVVNATLIDVMNKAVEETNFTYNATYNSKYGYFITSINGLTAKSPEWWHILGGDDNISIPVGASCYVPENGEQVLFKIDSTEVEDSKITDELILVIVLIVVFVASIVIAVLCRVRLK